MSGLISNYAARAEGDLLRLSKFQETELIRENFRTIARLISESVHFSIPDHGTILNDALRGFDSYSEFPRLPFPKITISTSARVDGGGEEKVLILCVEDTDAFGERLIVVQPIYPEEYGWVPTVFKMAIVASSPWSKDEGRDEIVMRCALFSNRTNDIMDDAEAEKYDHHSRHSVRALLELLEALTCKNVSMDVVGKVNANVNARRVRDGKLPIYETRVLVIEAGRESTLKSLITGRHASPRQHLRRGHIRRLASGNIWVNACVVGSAEKGVIDKRYIVTS